MPSITKRYNPAAITSHAQELIGKNINIVCLNKMVIFAQCLEITSDLLVIKNMRQKKQKVSLQDIQELIVDFKA